jgi:hypothetical protein
MIGPKTHQPSRSKTAVDPKSPPVNAAIKTGTPSSSSQDRTRERAYELYESRGREHGRNEQDWFRAEQEILERKR